MQKVAILVDGGYFLKRYISLFKSAEDYSHYNAEQTVKVLIKLMMFHLDKEDKLYRMLYYDCPPLGIRVTNPVSNRQINFGISDLYKYKMELFDELRSQRKVALRLGVLNDTGRWQINTKLTSKIVKNKIDVSGIREKDVTYQVNQKGVDMKIGLDIASLAYKKLVDKIILVAGDSDFVPAAKVARREGLDFVLDPMRNAISPDLNEHIDGLKQTTPREQCTRIASFLNGNKKHR